MSTFAASLLLALAAVPLAGSTSFQLGSGELGPVAAGAFDTARVRDGAVVVWADTSETASHVVRIDAAGKPVGATVALSVGGADCVNARVASDGGDALVVCSAGAVYAARIDEDGPAAPRLVAAAGTIAALAWNGRDYVVALRVGPANVAMLRLDRNGSVISGMALLRDSLSSELAFACGDTRCLAAFRNSGGRTRAAVIDEEDFPAIGDAPALVDSRPFFAASHLSLGYDELGFYSVVADSYSGPTLRRHGRLRGELLDRLQHPSRTINVWQSYRRGVYSNLVTASYGGDVYVAFTTQPYPIEQLLYRISSSGVQALTLPDATNRTILRVVPNASGALVFRADDFRRIYAAATNGDALPAKGEYVCLGLAPELMPRLARGNTTLLASWIEERDDDSLFVAILDLDGRPLTTPVRIARESARISDAVIAFDGVHFLVVWQPGFWWNASPRGQFIAQDGQPVGEPLDFDVATEVLSLLWSESGSSYLLSTREGLARISLSGALLDAEPQLGGWFDDMLLVRDPDDGNLRGLGMNFEGAIVSAGPQEFVSYHRLSVDDRVLPFRLDEDGARYEAAFDGNAVPAVAVGGGAELIVIDEYGWTPTHLRLLGAAEPLPYPQPATWDSRPRLHAHWTGREFVVIAGRTLARHAKDGTLLGTMSLGDDVLNAAAVGDGEDAVIVLRQRGSGSRSIEAVRIALPR